MKLFDKLFGQKEGQARRVVKVRVHRIVRRRIKPSK
jgi:hypothetical protein